MNSIETSVSMIDRLIKDINNNKKDSFYTEIPAIGKIENINLLNKNSKNSRSSQNLKTSQNNIDIINTFSPFDKYLIYPFLELCKPILNIFGINSCEVALVAILSFTFAGICYYNKNVLIWIYIFFGLLVLSIDKIIYAKDIKSLLIGQYNLLINFLSLIIIFIMLYSSELSYTNNKLYILILMNILLFILYYHISNNFEKSNKLKSYSKLLVLVKYFCINLSIVLFGYIIKNKLNGDRNSSNNIFDMFILNEH
jgi:hypothetical protein